MKEDKRKRVGAIVFQNLDGVGGPFKKWVINYIECFYLKN
jgi:hypothetical protein